MATQPVIMSNPISRLTERLDLESNGPHSFVGGAGPGGEGFMGRLYGGLVAAQAYVAAARSVDVGPIHSLHVYFLRPGRSALPIHYEVEAIKQGRRFQTRQVRATQDDQLIFQMMASFSADGAGVEHQDSMPEVQEPETLPNRDQARGKPGWEEQPIDLRTNDPAGDLEAPDHWIWMRPTQPLVADPVLHTAVLIFATDRALVRTAALPHRDAGEFAGASLDHSIWFHSPVEFDDWHLHTMHSPVARHERGLVLGAIYRADGTRVATTAQEGAIRFAAREP
jgi:acyl-CoA thioesterase-2